MGLFSKKIKMPNSKDLFWIEQNLEKLNYHNGCVNRTNNIEGFFNEITSIKSVVKDLIKYENKYPDYFNPKPTEILKNFNKNNKLILEKNFIDRYLMAIERKLLDYSTMRGKTNNFNKMVDLFRYYAGEFEPENVKYFEMKLFEDFPEFYQ